MGLSGGPGASQDDEAEGTEDAEGFHARGSFVIRCLPKIVALFIAQSIRDRGPGGAVRGNTSQEKPLQPFSSVRADDQQVRRLAFRENICWIADAHLRTDRIPAVHQRGGEILDQVFRRTDGDAGPTCSGKRLKGSVAGIGCTTLTMVRSTDS